MISYKWIGASVNMCKKFKCRKETEICVNYVDFVEKALNYCFPTSLLPFCGSFLLHFFYKIMHLTCLCPACKQRYLSFVFGLLGFAVSVHSAEFKVGLKFAKRNTYLQPNLLYIAVCVCSAYPPTPNVDLCTHEFLIIYLHKKEWQGVFLCTNSAGLQAAELRKLGGKGFNTHSKVVHNHCHACILHCVFLSE